MRGRRYPWLDGEPFTAVIVGCGLIGGSLALALRRRDRRHRVVVVDRPKVIASALARRVAHEGYPVRQLRRALVAEQPSLVVLAIDVAGIVDRLPIVAAYTRGLAASARPLVLDVASVKGPVVRAADELGLAGFVGGHPMAGRERGGLDHAEASLFVGARFVLCPSTTTRRPDLRAATRLVRILGAEPLVLEAAVHDRSAAMISHLPHLLAWSLLRAAADESDRFGTPRLPWVLAAGSWRDATRVAASDPELWEGILQANREAVLATFDEWLAVAAKLRRALARPDAAILDTIGAARLTRSRRKA